MVLFVTGRCGRSCWYCPLSSGRKGTDTVYANEHPIDIPTKVVGIAEKMNALGTGITGGEPLLCLGKVTEYCRLLKKRFGPGHHIHLYTAKAPTESELMQMKGLVDEIRIHPPHDSWKEILDSEFIESAKRAKVMGFDIGIEVPALPGLEYLIPALPYLDFLNINELEWGETNAYAMRERGFELADELHNAIDGARNWAEELLQHEKVHWCSSAFKDSVQLRERLKRIAKNTARAFDEITEDGTVVYGVLEIPPSCSNGGSVSDPAGALASAAAWCRENFGPESYELYPDRIETAWWLLSEHADKLPGGKAVVERYPDNGMIVERTPL